MAAGWQWEGVKAEGSLWLLGCVIRESLGRGRGGEGKRGHLELAQHGVTALLQVGQIEASLIILQPLEQGAECHRCMPRAGAVPQGHPGVKPRVRPNLQ